VNYKITDESYDTLHAISEIQKGHWIVFEADMLADSTWDVKFYEKGTSIEWYVKTNKGKELKVFSFIKLLLERLVHENDPEKIKFMAIRSELNRSKLYKKILQQYFKNYRIQSERIIGPISDLTASFNEFIVVKK
jgi:hypothetical protein